MPELGRNMGVIRAAWQPRKLAFVRALRSLRLDGTPGVPEDNAWLTFQAALASAPADMQEDWSLLVNVPRTDPAVMAFAAGLGVSEPVLDALFQLAMELDA